MANENDAVSTTVVPAADRPRLTHEELEIGGQENLPLSRTEMKEQTARLRKQFDQLIALRLDFARRLQNGPVSKEEVLRYFAETEEVLESERKQAQQEAVDRISSMSPEDRKRFAQRLLASTQPGFPVPPDAPPGL